jgi:hypothetical protein
MKLDMGIVTTAPSIKAQEQALLEKLGLTPGMTSEFHQIDVSEADMQKVIAFFNEEKLLGENARSVTWWV